MSADFVIYDILLWVLMPFTFVATLRLSLRGILKFPDHRLIRFVSSELWCISIVIYLPWHVVAFGSGDISPLPWRIFISEYAAFGLADAMLAVLIISVVDTWLLWTPAQIYISKLNGFDREKAKFARAINLLVGVLIFTPGHPFYRFIELL